MDRWTVERAVKGSNLDPPGRLLMLTLLTFANAATAVIPEQHTPSLSVLATSTGLAKSTVAAWLSRLDISGWVHRSRPDIADSRARHTRTRYRLSVPDGPHAHDRVPPTEQEHTDCRACPPPGHGSADQANEACPGDGHGWSDQAGPAGGHGDEGLVRHPDSAGSVTRTRPVSATRTQDNLDRSTADGHWFVSGPGGFCRLCRGARAEHPNGKEAMSA